MLSTAETAEMLKVSTRRVRKLAESGQLKATRIGSSWAIDESSVEERIASSPQPGRPANASDQDLIKPYTLMCRNDPVLDFNYHHGTKAVTKVRNIKAGELAPVGACTAPGRVTPLALGSWISNRYIPSNRIGVKALLKKAGVPDTSAFMFQSLGLNLTDQYWFRPYGDELDWDAINFFENDYVGDKHSSGPGSGTPGMLEKWWEKRDGHDYLVKAGSHGEREPYAELLSTRLYERLLEKDDFVPYTIESIDGKPHSVCSSFVEPNMQLVTLRDLFSCYARPQGEPYDHKKLIEICEQLGIIDAQEHIAKTIVCDFLTANTDRHDMNIGALRNVDTLRFERMAPLFDNGRCFFFDAQRQDDFGSGAYFHTSHPFSEYPSAQLALVNDYAWFDEERLAGFEQETEEILGKNDLAPEWFGAAAAAQFERQLDRVIEAKQERLR